MTQLIEESVQSEGAAPMQILLGNSAANEDHVAPTATNSLKSDAADSGAWNAYDVWRRLIKDARDRRRATGRAE